MPPKVKISREDIVSAGLEIVRAGGEEALNARAVAQRLGCSTQPIFSNYPSMEALKRDVIGRAQQIYQGYIAEGMRDPAYPPYKGSGMAYIRFARQERQLFRLLFMRNRAGEKIEEDWDSIAGILAVIRENTGLSQEEAYRFHLELWLCVHGIAVMSATSYLDWPMEDISAMLTDMYEGLKLRYADRRREK